MKMVYAVMLVVLMVACRVPGPVTPTVIESPRCPSLPVVGWEALHASVPLQIDRKALMDRLQALVFVPPLIHDTACVGFYLGSQRSPIVPVDCVRNRLGSVVNGIVGWHFIEPAERFDFYFPRLELSTTDRATGVTALRLLSDFPRTLIPIGDSWHMRVLLPVWSIHAPNGVPRVISGRVVGRYRHGRELMVLVRWNSDEKPSMGAPVLDSAGQVLAVITAPDFAAVVPRLAVQRESMAIPIHAIDRRVVEKPLHDPKPLSDALWSKSVFDVAVQDEISEPVEFSDWGMVVNVTRSCRVLSSSTRLSRRQLERLPLRCHFLVGNVVSAIAPNSPAAGIGLKVGDDIMNSRCDGVFPNNQRGSDITTLVATVAACHRVGFTVQRPEVSAEDFTVKLVPFSTRDAMR